MVGAVRDETVVSSAGAATAVMNCEVIAIYLAVGGLWWCGDVETLGAEGNLKFF